MVNVTDLSDGRRLTPLTEHTEGRGGAVVVTWGDSVWHNSGPTYSPWFHRHPSALCPSPNLNVFSCAHPPASAPNICYKRTVRAADTRSIGCQRHASRHTQPPTSATPVAAVRSWQKDILKGFSPCQKLRTFLWMSHKHMWHMLGPCFGMGASAHWGYTSQNHKFGDYLRPPAELASPPPLPSVPEQGYWRRTAWALDHKEKEWAHRGGHRSIAQGSTEPMAFRICSRDGWGWLGIRPRVSVRREVGPACADVWRGGGSTCADVWRTGWSACADIWQMCNAVFFFPLCIFEHLTGERRITAPGPHTQLFGGARH